MTNTTCSHCQQPIHLAGPTQWRHTDTDNLHCWPTEGEVRPATPAPPKFWTVEERSGVRVEAWHRHYSYKNRSAALRAMKALADATPGCNYRVVTGNGEGMVVHAVRSSR